MQERICRMQIGLFCDATFGPANDVYWKDHLLHVISAQQNRRGMETVVLLAACSLSQRMMGFPS